MCPLNLFPYALFWIGLWREHFYPIVFPFIFPWSQREESFESGVPQNPPGHTGSKLLSLSLC